MQENLARGLSVVSRAVSTRSTLPVLGNVLHQDRGRGSQADRDEPRDRDHLLGPRHGSTRTARSPCRPSCWRTSWPACRPASGSTSSSRPATRCASGPAGSRPTSRASTPRSSRPSRSPASDPPTRIPQRVLRQALNETTFAAASDEARPILTGVLCRFEGDQLTLAAADNYRIAVKTIPTLDPVEETSIVVPARSLNELSRVLADVDDPVDLVLAPSKNQILFHLDGDRPGQPAHRRPVPELPAGPAEGPHDPRGRRSRGAPQGGPAGRPHRELRGQHRQARGRGRRRAAIVVSAAAEVGDNEGRVEADRRGRRHDDRVQRPLSRGRPSERGHRAVRPRAQRPALAGRLPSGRRRRLHARRDAGPDHLLRRPGPDPACRPASSIDLLDLRGYASLRLEFAPGPAARLGSQRRRQDQPPRGDRAGRLGPLTSDDGRRRAHPVGHRPGPSRGGGGSRRVPPRATGSVRDDRGGRARPRGRRRTAQADPGERRATSGVGPGRSPADRRCSRPRTCSSWPDSPGLRRTALDALATSRSPAYAADLATYGRALQQRNGLLRAIREEQAGRDQLRFWDGALLEAGSAVVEGRHAALAAIAGPLARAHAEIAPDEGRLTLRYESNAPARPGETVREALARRLAETADKEVWNGTTLIGPHRDDLVFELEGRDLAAFASRGQQRTAILALKLAEVDLLTEQDGRPPLLLLDDVFSELDPDRRAHLVRRIADLPQAFVTTTSPDDLDPVLRASAAGWAVSTAPDGSSIVRGRVGRSMTSRRGPMTRIGDLLPEAARELGLERELRHARATSIWSAIVAERVPAASGACRLVGLEDGDPAGRGRSPDRGPGAPPADRRAARGVRVVAGRVPDVRPEGRGPARIIRPPASRPGGYASPSAPTIDQRSPGRDPSAPPDPRRGPTWPYGSR